MKIAIYGESPADEDAVELLVKTILDRPIERPSLPSLRARGYTQMAAELPRVIKSLHFNSDAEGLVLVIDSNGKPIHVPDHDQTDKGDPDCRLCILREVARRELAGLKSRPTLPPLKVAIGLAVPTLEAWLLSKRHAGMTETNWLIARKERPPREPFTRAQLKQLAYGTTTPSLELETQKMLELMTEVAADLQHLLTAFPGGFAPFFGEVQSWKPK